MEYLISTFREVLLNKRRHIFNSRNSLTGFVEWKVTFEGRAKLNGGGGGCDQRCTSWMDGHGVDH
jgi:hypothetical protein